MDNHKLINGYVLLVLLLATGFAETLIADEIWPQVPFTNSAGRRLSRVSYTTKAYHDEALKLILQEVNQAAKDMKLEEDLPLSSNNIVRVFVSPYGFARSSHAFGNITTHKFCYFISQGGKFSYVEGTHQTEDCLNY